VDFLENREKLHFMTVAADEWQKAHDRLKESSQA
jgi:transketolase